MISCSLVCTLFEGDYHYGVAALVNSLYKNGFRGVFFAGYKGDLPAWANQAKENPSLDWQRAKSLTVANDLTIHFLPIETNFHLAIYKPTFLLALRKYIHSGLFYFDPDIVIKCTWDFFESWKECGVAVIQEIVMNICSPNHPRRLRWASIIKDTGRNVNRQLNNYFNSGFCGVKKNDFDFIQAWYEVIKTGIDNSIISSQNFSQSIIQTDIIPMGDQDPFNIAAMCCMPEISDFGPEGMDFIYGGWLMSHATGSPKPWDINFISKALAAKKISLAEKNYWNNVNTLIITHKSLNLKLKQLSIKAASLINRFYLRT